MIVVRFSIVLTIMWLFEQMMWLCFLAVFSRVESTLVEGRLRSTYAVQLPMRSICQLDRDATIERAVQLCVQCHARGVLMLSTVGI